MYVMKDGRGWKEEMGESGLIDWNGVLWWRRIGVLGMRKTDSGKEEEGGCGLARQNIGYGGGEGSENIGCCGGLKWV